MTQEVILRPHQQQLVDATLNKLKTDRFALGVMAVASGKSYAAATIAKQFERVVVIQPSVELIRAIGLGRLGCVWHVCAGMGDRADEPHPECADI